MLAQLIRYGAKRYSGQVANIDDEATPDLGISKFANRAFESAQRKTNATNGIQRGTQRNPNFRNVGLAYTESMKGRFAFFNPVNPCLFLKEVFNA
jgi:hypothetical protein